MKLPSDASVCSRSVIRGIVRLSHLLAGRPTNMIAAGRPASGAGQTFRLLQPVHRYLPLSRLYTSLRRDAVSLILRRHPVMEGPSRVISVARRSKYRLKGIRRHLSNSPIIINYRLWLSGARGLAPSSDNALGVKSVIFRLEITPDITYVIPQTRDQ